MHRPDFELTPPIPLRAASDPSFIRHLPDMVPRLETGVVRAGRDWCGVFIRGDNAFGYAYALQHLIAGHSDVITMATVESLLKLLQSSDERFHSRHRDA